MACQHQTVSFWKPVLHQNLTFNKAYYALQLNSKIKAPFHYINNVLLLLCDSITKTLRNVRSV